MGRKSKEQDWTTILGWPGCRVYHYEINQKAKTLKLWVAPQVGNRKLVCSGCGRGVRAIHQIYQREIQNLPWSQFRTTVVWVCCPAGILRPNIGSDDSLGASRRWRRAAAKAA